MTSVSLVCKKLATSYLRVAFEKVAAEHVKEYGG